MRRHYLALGIFVHGLCGIASANSDTYNFYFKKKPGESATEGTPPQTATDSRRLDVASNAPGSPIVINNSNTLNLGSTPREIAPVPQAVAPAPTPAPIVPAPVAQAETPAAKVTENVSSASVKEDVRFYPMPIWRYGFFASASPLTGTDPMFGISMAFAPLRSFALNIFGEYQPNTRFLSAGFDVELYPIRWELERFDPLQVALIVGGSTLVAPWGQIGTPHVGARVNVGFSRSLGLFALARGNELYQQFEAGLLVRM